MPAFAETIRALRLQKNVPLRVVAAAVEIDSTLLSRIELGERFPTNEQTRKFAEFFQKPECVFSEMVIADRIIAANWKQVFSHPGFRDELQLKLLRQILTAKACNRKTFFPQLRPCAVRPPALMYWLAYYRRFCYSLPIPSMKQDP